ncbi:MAG: hypothetical protein KI790_04890 [Cyclobacteriaceae bacterium]|nr:hypothetical protein [Cyclobacteriaceae bacterium HetDA_MAG_MS6]
MTSTTGNEKFLDTPPFLRSWRVIYTLVITNLLVTIALLHYFSSFYR